LITMLAAFGGDRNGNATNIEAVKLIGSFHRCNRKITNWGDKWWWLCSL